MRGKWRNHERTSEEKRRDERTSEEIIFCLRSCSVFTKSGDGLAHREHVRENKDIYRVEKWQLLTCWKLSQVWLPREIYVFALRSASAYLLHHIIYRMRRIHLPFTSKWHQSEPTISCTAADDAADICLKQPRIESHSRYVSRARWNWLVCRVHSSLFRH